MSAIGLALIFGGLLTAWSGLHRVWVWDVLGYLVGTQKTPPTQVQSDTAGGGQVTSPTAPGGALAGPSDPGPNPNQIPLPSGGTLGPDQGGGGGPVHAS